MSGAVKKYLLISAGIAGVGLGTAGIFLPVLPTTPFLLLAAACFARSSDRLYAWLLHHKYLGKPVRNFREHKAISIRSKITALLLIWITIGYSCFYAVNILWVRILLLIIAVSVSAYILYFKTAKHNDIK